MGQDDAEQTWKECSNVVQNQLPYAMGYIYTRDSKTNARNSTLEIFESIKEEFEKLIASANWIDEAIREGLLNKLKALVPLIAHPPKGFNEREVKEFYSDVKIDVDQYLRTLLQLRIIDADNKFRQTYAPATVNDIDNWKKYLPPTSLSALYSESDNTLRKLIINPV
jgi:predicted metalloendopeptidase